MSKLQNFDIEFDRPGAVYAPGETVNGKVVFNLANPKNVREVRLKITGKAKIHWTESRGNHNDHFRRAEYYFKVINQLAGSETGTEEITLPAGSHSYPFSFELPANLPSSFEDQHGSIRYTVKAILDRPWKFDHKIVSQFTVLAPYNLSTQQEFAIPIDDQFEQEFSNLCCLNTGVMKFAVSSQKKGFSPSETIELKIIYDQGSAGVDITLIRMKLVKHTVLHATYKKKSKQEDLEEVHQAGPFHENGEISLKFIVPPVTPLNLKDCSIIDVDYELTLTFHTSGLHSNVNRSYRIQVWDIGQ